jgi:hypothetical protein
MNKTFLIEQLLNHLYEGRDDINFNVYLRTKDNKKNYFVKLTVKFGPEDGIISRINKKRSTKDIKKFLSSTLSIDNKDLSVVGEFVEYYSVKYEFI